MVQIATKTLAEIYRTQGDLQKAREIYEILAEQDPSDPEIQQRLDELNRLTHPSPSWTPTLPRSRKERIEFLQRWLSNIQKRKKR
ncbi:MAG: tetratricopeptide repeat protein [Desulfobacterota bacterium]|nr:tetratricopeptide repeat protein [Thermodesulfobacteriota bacterium]